MADTEDSFDIPTAWTNLNTLSAIPVGTEILVQNRGKFGDVIDVAISATEPAVDFNGVALDQFGFYGVDAGENDVWVRFIRLADQTPAKGTAKLQVQT
tara:strand:+ start:50 stop:343 length:294 start_codon:yes stop_codon:yes gene_type:complete